MNVDRCTTDVQMFLDAWRGHHGRQRRVSILIEDCSPQHCFIAFSCLAVVGSLKRSHFDLHIQDSTTIEDQINEINESIYMHITYNLYLITYIISICLTYFNQLTCISLNSLFWLLHPFLHSSSSFTCNVRSPTKTKILISVVKTIKNISIKTCSQVLVFLMTDSWSRGLNT